MPCCVLQGRDRDLAERLTALVVLGNASALAVAHFGARHHSLPIIHAFIHCRLCAGSKTQAASRSPPHATSPRHSVCLLLLFRLCFVSLSSSPLAAPAVNSALVPILAGQLAKPYVDLSALDYISPMMQARGVPSGHFDASSRNSAVRPCCAAAPSRAQQ